jgi:hypothetical protein
MARVRTGTIHKLPSGRWLARVTVPGGKRFGKTFLTKTDGNAWLHRQYAATSDGTWDKSSTLTVITFGDYAARWLAGRELAMRTREGYTDLLKQGMPRPWAQLDDIAAVPGQTQAALGD